MMISERLNEAINTQVGNEFGASIQYVAIAAFFAAEGLNQLASRFDAQANEERDHALKLVKYLLDTGGKVAIPAIGAPRHEFGSVADAVALALEQEQDVTAQINALMAMAFEDKDFAAQNFLNWFVAEQIEEVANMDNLLKVVKRAGEQNLVYVEAYVAGQASQVARGPGDTAAG
jgi:ferritin